GSRRLSDHASAIFGADPTPGLLAFALTDSGIRVWRREGGAPRCPVGALPPFLLLVDAALVAGAPGLLEVEALAGSGALRWRARFASGAGGLGRRARCGHARGH